MPFFEGYGLHDANWRGRFGATIFENRGSHGCVNIPPANVPIIFANVQIGTPVFITD
jgi:lipoprotein-anchoring transpeptidase ErfK/SrfK